MSYLFFTASQHRSEWGPSITNEETESPEKPPSINTCYTVRSGCELPEGWAELLVTLDVLHTQPSRKSILVCYMNEWMSNHPVCLNLPSTCWSTEVFSSLVVAKSDAGNSTGKVTRHWGLDLCWAAREWARNRPLWVQTAAWRHEPNGKSTEGHAARSRRQAFLIQFIPSSRSGQGSPRQDEWQADPSFLTPVQCLNAMNQAGHEVSTSFQWKLMVLWFPPELWWSLGSLTLLVQTLSHECSSMWGTEWDGIKAKLKVILKHIQ